MWEAHELDTGQRFEPPRMCKTDILHSQPYANNKTVDLDGITYAPGTHCLLFSHVEGFDHFETYIVRRVNGESVSSVLF